METLTKLSEIFMPIGQIAVCIAALIAPLFMGALTILCWNHRHPDKPEE